MPYGMLTATMEDFDPTPAKKSLGQHFLRHPEIAERITEAAEVNSRDIVVEVGPGKGILTRALLPAAREIIAIEKDERLAFRLTLDFKKEIQSKKLTLRVADILSWNPADEHLQKNGYKVVANIPYYLTGALIKKFLSEAIHPNTLVFMIQKEVAKRIVASDEKESLLSIAVKAYGTPRYIETVKAGSFSPPPKVDSAIIKIESISKKNFENVSENAFFAVLKAGFAKKRKKLLSNISDILPKEAVLDAFASAGLSENTRAEEVSLSLWLSLARSLSPAFEITNAANEL